MAVNDIGYVSYLARETEIVDLVGLATHEMARARMDRRLTREFVTELTRGQDVRLAVVFEEWWGPPGLLPDSWSKIASWTIGNNLVVPFRTIDFFSPDRSLDRRLLGQLLDFNALLPPGVVVTFHVPPDLAGDT